MSHTVSTVSRSSRARVPTARAKSRTVRGSEMSRFCAMSDISRWWRTSHSTRLGLLGHEAEARGHAARDARAQDRVVLGPPLSDVVQQQRHHQDTAVDRPGHDGGGQRQLRRELPALDERELDDALDDVLVHREMVVHVELHHRHDRLELGDEGAQHPELVHAPERALGVAVLEQQREEDAVGLRVGAHPPVDPPEAGADQAHRVGMQQAAPS